MSVVRWAVSLGAAAAWLTLTWANGTLLWQKLVDGRESGSFIPFAALVFGEMAIFAYPGGGLPAPRILVWIPVVLDVGVLLWSALLVQTLAAKLRGGSVSGDGDP